LDKPFQDGAAGSYRDFSSYLDTLDALIRSGSVRIGFRHWRDVLRGRRMPARGDIDPVAIGRGLLRVSLLDVTRDPLDFRVRLVGEFVRAQMGAQRGQRIVDTVGVEQGRDRILKRFGLCVGQALPIRGLYRYVPLTPPERLIWVEAVSCPLSDDGMTVHHIVNFGADAEFDVAAGTPEQP